MRVTQVPSAPVPPTFVIDLTDDEVRGLYDLAMWYLRWYPQGPQARLANSLSVSVLKASQS